MLAKSSFKFEYHIQLHQALKKLLIKVINQNVDKLQLVYLKEVYIWYMRKLVTLGLLSKREQEKEAHILNPVQKTLAASMQRMVKHKVLSALVNEQDKQETAQSRFEQTSEWLLPERTIHTEIPPAHVRI